MADHDHMLPVGRLRHAGPKLLAAFMQGTLWLLAMRPPLFGQMIEIQIGPLAGQVGGRRADVADESGALTDQRIHAVRQIQMRGDDLGGL